jgi:hypothetical protein
LLVAAHLSVQTARGARTGGPVALAAARLTAHQLARISIAALIGSR